MQFLQLCFPTVLGSNEAHFHISGTVNKQHFRYWAAENPLKIHQWPLYSPKVTVWCALYTVGIVGPYFFEEDGVTVTVTFNRYCEMLENFYAQKLKSTKILMPFGFNRMGPQLIRPVVLALFLQETFPGRLNSLRENITRPPPRSPDLSPCDYFL